MRISLLTDKFCKVRFVNMNPCLNGFLGVWVECIKDHVCILEVSFHCVKVQHVLGEYPCTVSSAAELKHLFGDAFQLFLQLNKVGCRRQ
jgi:hypothetical protein